MAGARTLFEDLGADMRRRPLVVEHAAIEIVVIVACRGYYIKVPVGDADELVALTHHLARIGITVVPCVHHHILRLDGRLARRMRQRTPHARLLAVALHKAYVPVGELAELLDHGLVLVRVLVGADMHARPAEDGVVTRKVLLEEAVEKFVGSRIEQVEMVHTVLLAAQLRVVMAEGQRMCRRVDLGYDLHEPLLGQFLQIDELALGVAAVARRKVGICLRLEAEGGIGLVPVILEILFEAVVVKMYLQGVHLVVGQYLNVVLQEMQGDELAAAVDHKAAHGIVGPVAHLAARQRAIVALLGHLQQRARRPIYPFCRGGLHIDTLAGYGHCISLIPEFLVGLDGQRYVTAAAAACCNCGTEAEHLGAVVGQHPRHPFERLVARGVNDARILRRDETSFAAMPRLEFRYYERSGVLCGRRRGYARTPHRGEHKNLKQKSHVYKIFIRVSKAAQPQGRRATCKISKFSDITHPICEFYPNRPSAGSESRTTETAHR